MRRIILDTNVVISALIGQSHPREIIYNHVLNSRVIVCLSQAVFEEYVDVVHRPKFLKYPTFVSNAEKVLNRIEQVAVKYIPIVKLETVRDHSDNKFLELAVAANADYLVTGDRNDFGSIQVDKLEIISPSQFIARCKS